MTIVYMKWLSIKYVFILIYHFTPYEYDSKLGFGRCYFIKIYPPFLKPIAIIIFLFHIEFHTTILTKGVSGRTIKPPLSNKTQPLLLLSFGFNAFWVQIS